MKRENLKEYIDNILIEKCGLPKTFFSMKSNDGENILIYKELLYDPLSTYEVVSIIEHKCGVLINDEVILNDNLTYKDFIDIFWNEIKRDHKEC